MSECALTASPDDVEARLLAHRLLDLFQTGGAADGFKQGLQFVRAFPAANPRYQRSACRTKLALERHRNPVDQALPAPERFPFLPPFLPPFLLER